MAKKAEPKNVPVLPLDTQLILRAFHKTTGEMFEKKITYSEYLEFPKNKDYHYKAFQLI